MTPELRLQLKVHVSEYPVIASRSGGACLLAIVQGTFVSWCLLSVVF